MPLTPFGMDPETPGSRFTLHPAIAIRGLRPLDSESEQAAAVADVMGTDVFEARPGLGAAAVIPGSMGRGGSGSAAVVQWVLTLAVGGIIGGAAWDGVKTAARAFMDLVRQAKTNDDGFVISRGGAALLAIAEIEDLDESAGGILIEAVEEPSSIAGLESPEFNYVGVEPWIVILVDFNASVHYVIAVGPNGDILGRMRFPLQRLEPDYHPRGPTSE